MTHMRVNTHKQARTQKQKTMNLSPQSGNLGAPNKILYCKGSEQHFLQCLSSVCFSELRGLPFDVLSLCRSDCKACSDLLSESMATKKTHSQGYRYISPLQ